MLSSAQVERCSECSGRVIDVGDELVCKSCGMVTAKEVLESRESRAPQAVDFTKHVLGGYLGPLEYGYRERFSTGFSKASSDFRYLKLVSDYSGREDSSLYACAKMIERVCEKLRVPRIVVSQSMVIAKKLLELRRARSEITVAVISAYSIITACKIEKVVFIGVKEVVEAHRSMGRRVKLSSLIQISLVSPVKLPARKPEEYLTRVIARLSSNLTSSTKFDGEYLTQTRYYNRLREAARKVLYIVEDARGGHSPCGLAATAVYAAEVALARLEMRRRFLSQRDVASSVDIAEYTVREQYGEVFRPVERQIEETVTTEAIPIRPLAR